MFTARAAGLTAFLSLIAMPAFADPPRNMDALVSRAMQLSGVPGMAVAIVEHGQVTLARGYGVRRLGSTDAVDADTIFEIGSVSKGFTAAALAVLVDRGEIRWDDPVIDHIPGFQMYDSWATREITVLDLLVHRSGLGAGEGDLLYFPRTTLTRAETVPLASDPTQTHRAFGRVSGVSQTGAVSGESAPSRLAETLRR